VRAFGYAPSLRCQARACLVQEDMSHHIPRGANSTSTSTTPTTTTISYSKAPVNLSETRSTEGENPEKYRFSG
jgi:hypothetical protein